MSWESVGHSNQQFSSTEHRLQKILAHVTLGYNDAADTGVR